MPSLAVGAAGVRLRYRLGRDEIGPSVALIIKNDAQIVEISAKKELDDTTHYHVEVIAL